MLNLAVLNYQYTVILERSCFTEHESIILHHTSAKPGGALDILITLNASQ